MKKEYNQTIDGKEYKEILKFDGCGSLIWFKQMPKDGAGSGVHLILGKPEENHYDYYTNGIKNCQKPISPFGNIE